MKKVTNNIAYEFYQNSAKEISSNFTWREFQLILVGEVYNLYLVYHLLRLKDDFEEAQQFEFCAVIRKWLDKNDVE